MRAGPREPLQDHQYAGQYHRLLQLWRVCWPFLRLGGGDSGNSTDDDMLARRAAVAVANAYPMAPVAFAGDVGGGPEVIVDALAVAESLPAYYQALASAQLVRQLQDAAITHWRENGDVDWARLLSAASASSRGTAMAMDANDRGQRVLIGDIARAWSAWITMLQALDAHEDVVQVRCCRGDPFSSL